MPTCDSNLKNYFTKDLCRRIFNVQEVSEGDARLWSVNAAGVSDALDDLRWFDTLFLSFLCRLDTFESYLFLLSSLFVS